MDVIRVVDSYASLLTLLLANFFLLEIVDDPRWGALGSTISLHWHWSWRSAIRMPANTSRAGT